MPGPWHRRRYLMLCFWHLLPNMCVLPHSGEGNCFPPSCPMDAKRSNQRFIPVFHIRYIENSLYYLENTVVTYVKNPHVGVHKTNIFFFLQFYHFLKYLKRQRNKQIHDITWCVVMETLTFEWTSFFFHILYSKSSLWRSR